MVADFREGEILGELQDLDEEMETVDFCIYLINSDSEIVADVCNRRNKVLMRLLEKLKREKDRQQMRLRVHRQRVQDSGIKY